MDEHLLYIFHFSFSAQQTANLHQSFYKILVHVVCISFYAFFFSVSFQYYITKYLIVIYKILKTMHNAWSINLLLLYKRHVLELEI
jgi:hypothetical protein